MKNIFNNYKIYLSISACLLLVAPKLQAQDIHFSLYEETGQVINPGLTGIFTGDMRISTNFRSQWASLGAPYKTFAAAMDMKR